MDKTDLHELYREHVRTVYAFLLSMCRHRETAEDLTQETFTRATLYLDKLCQETVRGWLLRTARNLYIDWWRKNKNRATLSLDIKVAKTGQKITGGHVATPIFPQPEEHALQSEQRKLLEAVLAQLPDHFRTAVVLRDVLHLTYREIGEITGWSAAKVKATISRGRLRFAEDYRRFTVHMTCEHEQEE